MISLHWSAVILFLLLALLGLWAAYSFMNKTGLYLFAIVAVMLQAIIPASHFFNDQIIISISTMFMPLILFAVIVVAEKYTKTDAKRLTYVILALMGVLFLTKFFVAAYLDSAMGGQYALSWTYLGSFVFNIVGFAASAFVLELLSDRIKMDPKQKYLRRSILLSIASAVYAVLFSCFSYIGFISFGNIMLILLISLVLMTGVSFGVCFLRKFLNREPSVTLEQVEKQQEKASAEKEPKTEKEATKKTDDKVEETKEEK